ncbi:MAG: replication and repair protein RecF [Actinomycetota bacterium]|nr:replication and repair protein RecF [Actinomycetota bacterium]
MRLRRLWLTDFRSYDAAELAPAKGLTVVVGANGEGKTNLLEAIGYLGTLSSFRGAPGDALIRQGCSTAVVRADVVDADGREALLEAELRTTGRDRVLVNKQPLRRARDLLGTLRVSVFSPDDLVLVKGGPAERRAYLDQTLVACAPKHDQTLADLDRVLRQRNALLKSCAGAGRGGHARLDTDAAFTLDVFDAKLAQVGDRLGAARASLAERLEPVVAKAYDVVASAAASVSFAYDAPWRAEGLAARLAAARAEDVRRGVTTVGPHRDDVVLTIEGMPARTHASQGEQRSLSLALRLAAHELVTEFAKSAPILLLDDVFSELDPDRSVALLRALPHGQALLTTAGVLPQGLEPDQVVSVRDGKVVA